MNCAVMQPTYLPWSGYFALINLADTFMFYDDAQFSKSSWHYRNRLLCGQETKWLSLDIQHHQGQNINETKLALFKKIIRKHQNTLTTYYSKSAYYHDAKEIMTFLTTAPNENLAEFNMALIMFISQKLTLSTQFLRSSEFVVTGERSNKLAQYLEMIHCKCYLSPKGAQQYLQEDNIVETHFPVTYCDFEPTVYPQHSNKNNFTPYLSIIDAVANIGWQATSKYIRNMSCQIKNTD